MRATLRGGADLLTAVNYLNHEFSGHTQEIRIEALDANPMHNRVHHVRARACMLTADQALLKHTP